MSDYHRQLFLQAHRLPRGGGYKATTRRFASERNAVPWFTPGVSDLPRAGYWEDAAPMSFRRVFADDLQPLGEGDVYDESTGDYIGHFFDGGGYRDEDTSELFYRGQPVEDDGVGGFAALAAKVAAKKVARGATKAAGKGLFRKVGKGALSLASTEEGQGMISRAKEGVASGRFSGVRKKFKFRRRWLTTRLAPAISIKVRSGHKVSVKNVGTREDPVWQVRPATSGDAVGFVVSTAMALSTAASLAAEGGKRLWEQEQEIQADPWFADLGQGESVQIGAVLVDSDGYREEL